MKMTNVMLAAVLSALSMNVALAAGGKAKAPHTKATCEKAKGQWDAKAKKCTVEADKGTNAGTTAPAASEPAPAAPATEPTK
jgi:hypothetical protein